MEKENNTYFVLFMFRNKDNNPTYIYGNSDCTFKHNPPKMSDIRDMELLLQKKYNTKNIPIILNFKEITPEEDINKK